MLQCKITRKPGAAGVAASDAGVPSACCAADETQTNITTAAAEALGPKRAAAKQIFHSPPTKARRSSEVTCPRDTTAALRSSPRWIGEGLHLITVCRHTPQTPAYRERGHPADSATDETEVFQCSAKEGSCECSAWKLAPAAGAQRCQATYPPSCHPSSCSNAIQADSGIRAASPSPTVGTERADERVKKRALGCRNLP